MIYINIYKINDIAMLNLLFIIIIFKFIIYILLFIFNYIE